MKKKEDILELRDRARKELFVLFGVKPKEITEAQIMYMVGLYQQNVDTMELAVSMMDNDWSKQYPNTPNEDIDEESEEQRAVRKWERCRIR